MKNNKLAARIGAVVLAACLGMTDVAPAFAAEVTDPVIPAAEEQAVNPDTEEAAAEEQAVNPDTEEAAAEEQAVNPDTEEAAAEEQAVNPDTEEAAAEEQAVNPDTEEAAAEEQAVNPDTEQENAEGPAAATKIAVEPAGAAPEQEVQSTGTAGTPARVTGLKVSGRYLTWDPQEMTAYGYDIMATNQSGIKYYSYSAPGANGWIYGLDSPTEHHFYYLRSENKFELTKYLGTNGSGTTAYRTPGMSYKYQVRAVNRVSSKDAHGNTVYRYAYGPWSNEVSFKLPLYTKLTKVKVDTEQRGENKIYVNLGEAVDWYDLYVTIYADAACRNAVKRTSVYRYNDANTKAYFDIYGLTPGQTYYAKIYNANDWYDNDTELMQAGNVTYSNVFTFKPQAKAAPGTTLSIAKTEANSYYLSASSAKAMANYNSSHYVQLYSSTDNKNWNEYNKYYGTGNMAISNSFLANCVRTPNTPVYFKAQAYVDGVGGAESNVLVLKSPAITRISGLNYEQTKSGYALRYTGNIKSNVETVIYEYSTDKNFKKNFATQDENKVTKSTTSSVLSYDNLIPGKTYYVRAFVKSSYYSDADTIYKDQHSTYTNVLTIKAAVPDIQVSTSVTAKSVKLMMSRASDAQGPVTGYQIARKRKSGKSYTELKKTTDNVYTDDKLTSDTKYTYRVRAYYCNPTTKKMYYGAWSYVSATTWGSSLELKASAVSTTSVKLSWKKVSGANGYEIYRYVGDGVSKYYTGEGSFSKKQLIKTIKKSTTNTYTDKGLTAGESYEYVVRAYRTSGGKTYYIDEYATVNLALGSVVLDKVTQSTKTGKTTVTWKKVPAAKGYLIERYDTDTQKWKSVKNIKKNSTVKCVLPAVTGDKTSVEYRIRAYAGKKYSYATSFTAARHVATVGTVKAKASAKNGSVTVSWKKVKGADYYKVYRTTSSYSELDNRTNAIEEISGARLLNNYKADMDVDTGYDARDYVTGTSLVDKKVSYTNKYGEEVILANGPQRGLKYYYYVKAFKIVDEGYNASEAAKNDISLTNYTAVSSYGYSKAASATVSSAKVGAPTIKSVKSSKKKQVSITLTKKVSGAVSYEIYRSTKKNSGYKKIGTTTKISYTDKTATSKKTYYYKVKAVSRNEVGLNIYSASSKPSKAVKAK